MCAAGGMNAMNKNQFHTTAGVTGHAETRTLAPARYRIRGAARSCCFANQPCTDAGGIVGTGVIYGPVSALP